MQYGEMEWLEFALIGKTKRVITLNEIFANSMLFACYNDNCYGRWQFGA